MQRMEELRRSVTPEEIAETLRILTLPENRFWQREPAPVETGTAG
jgi:hypothetical protein